MLSNYALIAWRRLARERMYVVINILSLALGIGGFLVLSLYMYSELTYDRHHANHERIYRLTAHFNSSWKATEDSFGRTQLSLAPLLVKDFPQLGQYVRFFNPEGQYTLKHEDNSRAWGNVYFTDPSVFDIFTHHILYGDPKRALAEPQSIAVSKSFANHYFGPGNPIGKKVTDGAFTYAVTLVFDDLPENSHLKYDALFPLSMLDVLMPELSAFEFKSLGRLSCFSYLLVRRDFDPRDFAAMGAKFFETHMPDWEKENKETFRPGLQRLTDMHFGERLQVDLPTGNVFYFYGFGAVALFILAVACINYVNLATARAIKRSREVGMRKVLGANRAQLVAQFLGESFMFTAIALLLALALIYLGLTLTPLGSLMNKHGLLRQLLDPLFAGGIVALAVVVALAAGLYPALYLSSISPLAALTHQRRSWRSGLPLRQILVFAQLAISIAVIACTLLMVDQMRYVHSLPLGFDKENRLSITLQGRDGFRNASTIRSQLRRLPQVVDVTTASSTPGTGSGQLILPVETNAGVMEPSELAALWVGMNFVDAMKLRVLEGRAFSADIATDVSEAVMVNEATVRKLGWEQPLGKRLQTWSPNGPITTRVIGVFKDFHYASLHSPVGPMLLDAMPEQPQAPPGQDVLLRTSFIVVLTGADMHRTLDSIAAVIKRFDPQSDFEPVFLEDRLNDLYATETNLMKLIGVFSGICILICVMGIFGLAAFTTEQRTREIGIRKVLGAADSQIVGMLSRPLLWLVLLAAIPSCYLGYRVIDSWLQRFAYHTDIRVLTFVLATAAVALIALTTVVTQSLRAANANPVDALRYE